MQVLALLSYALKAVLSLKLGLQTVQGRQALRDFWDWIGPGGRLHPQEFLERFHGHIVIECLLAVVIGYLFIQRSFKGSSKSPKLLSEEVRRLNSDCCIAPWPLYIAMGIQVNRANMSLNIHLVYCTSAYAHFF